MALWVLELQCRAAGLVHWSTLHIPCSRYGEKRQRMVLGDAGVFDELFSYACPKFITAAPPNYDAPVSVPATGLIARCFRCVLCEHSHADRLPVTQCG